MAISLNTIYDIFNSLSIEDKEKFTIVIKDYEKSRDNKIKKAIGEQAIVEINFHDAIDYLIQNHFPKNS